MYKYNPQDKLIARQIVNSFVKPQKKCYVNNIIICKDDVLLLRRSPRDEHPNCWCLAGGNMEPKETILQSCSRETYEETGLKPIVDYVLLGNPYRIELNDCIIYYFVSSLVNEEAKAKIVLDEDEHSNYMWASRSQYETMNLLLDLDNHLKQILH